MVDPLSIYQSLNQMPIPSNDNDNDDDISDGRDDSVGVGDVDRGDDGHDDDDDNDDDDNDDDATTTAAAVTPFPAVF